MSPAPNLSLRLAREADNDRTARLWAEAYLSFVSLDQTMRAPVLTLLASDARSRAWGIVVLQVEPRPPTLPASLQGRIYVRGLAVAPGRTSQDDVHALLVHTRRYLRNRQMAGQIILITDRLWLQKAAVRSGFRQVDALLGLQRNLRIGGGGNPGGLVRTVRDTDYRALACRDVDIFGPLWHMGEDALRQQAEAGCLLVHQMDAELTGFALFDAAQPPFGQAIVTRLAVWPEWQGCRIGSHLLMKAMAQLRQEAVDNMMSLNVLESNTRARQFYARHGFRALGRPHAVLTCPLDAGFRRA